MVGRRNRAFYPPNKDRQPGDQNGNGDLESGHLGANKDKGGRPAIFRFQDAANTALGGQRREDLKQKLLHGINRDGLEKFRKSDEELKEIKNKKVRKFYEGQNDRLNDWMEVDAIVMSLADDVLDSMDPDPDNDGVRERGQNGLANVGGNIWDFLPEEEKNKRQTAEKKAKWAININVIANVILVIAKVYSRCFHRQSALTKMPTAGSRDPIVVSLPDRLPRRLRTGSTLHPHRLDHQPPCAMAFEVA